MWIQKKKTEKFIKQKRIMWLYIFHHILMMHLHPENTQVLWMDFVPVFKNEKKNILLGHFLCDLYADFSGCS